MPLAVAPKTGCFSVGDEVAVLIDDKWCGAIVTSVLKNESYKVGFI